MELEEAEELQDIIISVYNYYFQIPTEKIKELFKIYFMVHKTYDKEDLIHFIKMNIDLNNLS